MKSIIKILIIALSLASQLQAQSIRMVGTDKITPGNLVILQAENIEDARIVWDLRYPDEFEQWSDEGMKLFVAMPNFKVGLSLLVIPNDPTEPIEKVRYTLTPNTTAEPVTPGPVTPEPETGMWDGLHELAETEFGSMVDAQTKYLLGKSWQTAVNRLNTATTIPAAVAIIKEAKHAAFLGLEGQKLFWNLPIMEVSNFIESKKPTTVAEYEAAMRIIVEVLLE